MRLNAFLARAGVSSRRGADTLIREGRVTLNGKVAQLGATVGEYDRVTLDSVPLAPQAPIYVVLHKPAGIITTVRDPQGRPTVVDLVRREERVFPVGRLDADTTGALLLTNDGALAHRLAHPSFGVEKTYIATVRGAPDGVALGQLRDGVELDDGVTAPSRVRLLSNGARDRTGDEILSRVKLVLHEGRNHQVKRMLLAVGHPVVGLHRSHYASITVDGLDLGEWRELTDAELRTLRQLTAGVE